MFPDIVKDPTVGFPIILLGILRILMKRKKRKKKKERERISQQLLQLLLNSTTPGISIGLGSLAKYVAPLRLSKTRKSESRDLP